MRAGTLALVSVIAAALLAIVCHPRVFFGSGTAMSVVSLDGVFFAGQWIAFALAALALVSSALAMSAGTGTKSVVVAAIAVLLLVWLLISGVPHPANRGEWRNRELGVGAFMRGMTKRRAENAPPPALSANAFAGEWQGEDGTTFTFENDRISWRGSRGNGEYSASSCGSAFRVAYTARNRDVLQDFGLTWSTHAGERFDATQPDARVAVAQVECAGTEPVTFIKAARDEVWRWTSSLDLDAIKRGAFVLRRARDP